MALLIASSIPPANEAMTVTTASVMTEMTTLYSAIV